MPCIRIERDADGFDVTVTNPEIDKANEKSDSAYQDPTEEYDFATWDEVKAFLDKVYEAALPEEQYNQAFAKAAKEAASGK